MHSHVSSKRPLLVKLLVASLPRTPVWFTSFSFDAFFTDDFVVVVVNDVAVAVAVLVTSTKGVITRLTHIQVNHGPSFSDTGRLRRRRRRVKKHLPAGPPEVAPEV